MMWLNLVDLQARYYDTVGRDQDSEVKALLESCEEIILFLKTLMLRLHERQ